MCCSVEVKEAPPTPQGWQWLFMRVETRVIKKGRNDIGVVIMDGEGRWRRLLCQWRGIGRLRGRKCEVREEEIRFQMRYRRTAPRLVWCLGVVALYEELMPARKGLIADSNIVDHAGY
jgi:hypothetical protein